MNKQELALRIVRDMGYEYQTVRNIIDGIAFEGWLHDPDQVPGRTITESESKRLFAAARSGLDFWPPALESTGITVVPDPEPSNAEKLESKLKAFALEVSVSEHQIELARSSAPELAAWLDEHGVKAPGANDDH